ncbi:MAG: hypothetical protein ACLUTU_07965 [Blautia faecis]
MQIVGIIFQTRSDPKNKACIPAAGSHIIYILCQQSENTGFSFLFYASRITLSDRPPYMLRILYTSHNQYVHRNLPR